MYHVKKTCKKSVNVNIEKARKKQKVIEFKNEKKYACTYCDKVYGGSTGLKTHMKLQHEDLPDLVCESCEFSTKDARKMKTHVYRLHEIEKHPKCSHCDYRSGFVKTKLKRHLSMSADRKLVCYDKLTYFRVKDFILDRFQF